MTNNRNKTHFRVFLESSPPSNFFLACAFKANREFMVGAFSCEHKTGLFGPVPFWERTRTEPLSQVRGHGGGGG